MVTILAVETVGRKNQARSTIQNTTSPKPTEAGADRSFQNIFYICFYPDVFLKITYLLRHELTLKTFRKT